MAKIKEEYKCALLLTMDLVGGKWKMRLLWHINNGDNRFSKLKKGIPDITEKMLTTQLRDLENSGLINREIICEKPLNVQYSLSKEYKKLGEILQELCDFTKFYSEVNNIELRE